MVPLSQNQNTEVIGDLLWKTCDKSQRSELNRKLDARTHSRRRNDEVHNNDGGFEAYDAMH